MNLLQRILDFGYRIVEKDCKAKGTFLNALFIERIGGKMAAVQLGNVSLSESSGLVCICPEPDAEINFREHLKNGKAMKIDPEALYRSYYAHMSDEDYNRLRHGKQKRLLDIGLVRHDVCNDPIKFDNTPEVIDMMDLGIISFQLGVSDGELGMIDGLYCFQFGLSNNIDDYIIKQFYFTMKPSHDVLREIVIMTEEEIVV